MTEKSRRSVSPDFKTVDGRWVKTFYEGSFQRPTKSYQVWYNMKQRCNTGGVVQKRHPTYEGCFMSENFKDFQFFVAWFRKQIGYWENYELDKDILARGNREYGEGCCVLVPSPLNSFFTDAGAGRGAWPQGVVRRKDTGMFRVQMNVDGVLQRHGQYSSPEAAYEAYKEVKETEARRWYKRLCDGEFVVDSRVVERMRTWTL